MIGAIIGDIVGSSYEFNPTNNYNFELFPSDADFTDDTICTIAVADAAMNGGSYGEKIHEWCNRYPNPKGGYGGKFAQWVHSKNPTAYNSFGNGAAMRVSPIGWLFDNLGVVYSNAACSAMCSHNHIEGQRGAECIAGSVYIARHGGSKADIIAQAYDMFGYDISKDSPDNYRNKFDETCQRTIPAALLCIRDSHDFESAIRLAVSLGADADTLGAIVGSIAEPLYGVPVWMQTKALSYLPDDMMDIYLQFSLR